MFYLNESRNNDAKRTLNFYKLLKENPFKYHKKKNYFLSPSECNVNNKNNGDNNSELSLFYKENERIVKSFHSIMKSKSTIMDKNKRNYLNFLEKEKEKKYNNHININKSQDINYKHNYKIDTNLINSFSISPKYNKNISDVTNPNYFDNIAKKLIMKKNFEIMSYNNNDYKSKYNINSSINKNYFLNKNRNIPLAPGKINNPRYYFLGESKLDRNIIVNPGNRCLSPVYNFNKKKSEFGSF